MNTLAVLVCLIVPSMVLSSDDGIMVKRGVAEYFASVRSGTLSIDVDSWSAQSGRANSVYQDIAINYQTKTLAMKIQPSNPMAVVHEKLIGPNTYREVGIMGPDVLHIAAYSKLPENSWKEHSRMGVVGLPFGFVADGPNTFDLAEGIGHATIRRCGRHNYVLNCRLDRLEVELEVVGGLGYAPARIGVRKLRDSGKVEWTISYCVTSWHAMSPESPRFPSTFEISRVAYQTQAEAERLSKNLQLKNVPLEFEGREAATCSESDFTAPDFDKFGFTPIPNGTVVIMLDEKNSKYVWKDGSPAMVLPQKE